MTHFFTQNFIIIPISYTKKLNEDNKIFLKLYITCSTAVVHLFSSLTRILNGLTRCYHLSCNSRHGFHLLVGLKGKSDRFQIIWNQINNQISNHLNTSTNKIQTIWDFNIFKLNHLLNFYDLICISILYSN